MRIFNLSQIQSVIDVERITKSIEEGFIAYSTGNAQMPLPGHLSFPETEGECHIKFCHVRSSRYFVVKIATGFFRNASLGVPTSNGFMSVWNSTTGALEGILLDQGFLTDLRTAIAGRIVAKYCAPPQVPVIGVIGTGLQAKLQVKLLEGVISTQNIIVWGRSSANTQAYKEEMDNCGYSTTVASTIEEVGEASNFIVTTTASRIPLLTSQHLRSGTHVTAVGADGEAKNEIDSSVFWSAKICIADSLTQCTTFGDLSFAVTAGFPTSVVTELGTYINECQQGIRLPRTFEGISIADLTGLGIQDAQIASCVFDSLIEQEGNQ